MKIKIGDKDYEIKEKGGKKYITFNGRELEVMQYSGVWYAYGLVPGQNKWHSLQNINEQTGPGIPYNQTIPGQPPLSGGGFNQPTAVNNPMATNPAAGGNPLGGGGGGSGGGDNSSGITGKLGDLFDWIINNPEKAIALATGGYAAYQQLSGGGGSGGSGQGGGFLDPSIIQSDPTPPALKPLQGALVDAFMQRMAGGQPINQHLGQGLPTYGSIHQQLYGPGNLPGANAGMNGPMPQIPSFQNAQQQLVSGSRLIRANNQPY